MLDRYRLLLIRINVAVIDIAFAASASSAPMTGIITLVLVAAVRMLSRPSVITTLLSFAWRRRPERSSSAANAKVADAPAGF